MEPLGFFRRHGPFKILDIAWRLGADIAPGADGGQFIEDIKPLSEAGRHDLAFLDNSKYLGELASTKAGACLLKRDFEGKLPTGTVGLFTARPYHALADALSLFYPDALHAQVCPEQESWIHADAGIEDGAQIQPGAVIGALAAVGAGTVVAAGAVVGVGVKIGRRAYIGSNAVVTHAYVGNRVIIHAGAKIGQDGFGFAMGPEAHVKVPQIGRVIIQDDVEIGANSTVDRGALSDTVIGEGTKIDNLVQIGHNVRIGRHCVIAGQAGISGSAVLGDFVAMGGQAGCAGHIHIGTGAQVAAASGISRSIPPGERWGGIPARPVSQWSREIAVIKSLGAMLEGKTLARLKRLLG